MISITSPALLLAATASRKSRMYWRLEDRVEVLVAGVRLLVAGNDRLGAEALDQVDALDPLLPLLWAGEREHHVNPVVDHVAADHGVDRRNVDDRARRDVALGDLDHAQLVTFEVDHVALQRFRDHGGPVDVVAEPALPLLL